MILFFALISSLHCSFSYDLLVNIHIKDKFSKVPYLVLRFRDDCTSLQALRLLISQRWFPSRCLVSQYFSSINFSKSCKSSEDSNLLVKSDIPAFPSKTFGVFNCSSWSITNSSLGFNLFQNLFSKSSSLTGLFINWSIYFLRVHVPQKIIIDQLAFCQFCLNYLNDWLANSFQSFLKVYYRNFSVVLGKVMVPNTVF